MNRKILVVGGTGFLGRYLVPALTQKNYQVTTASHRAHSHHLAPHQKLDVLQLSQVKKLVKQNDLIINLTGQISAQNKSRFDLNSTGVYNLITACNLYQRKLIQLSSVLVYGTTKRVNESSPFNPESSYAMAKAFSDFLVQTLMPTHQQLTIRLSNLYGERQLKGLFYKLLETVRAHQVLEFPDNDGSLSRHFLHAADAAQIITNLIDHQAGGCYNVAGSEQWNIKQLVKLLEKLTGQRLPVVYGSLPPQSNIGVISQQKLKKTLSRLQYDHNVKTYFKHQLSQA